MFFSFFFNHLARHTTAEFPFPPGLSHYYQLFRYYEQ